MPAGGGTCRHLQGRDRGIRRYNLFNVSFSAYLTVVSYIHSTVLKRWEASSCFSAEHSAFQLSSMVQIACN